jgi:hypothetical protein
MALSLTARLLPTHLLVVLVLQLRGDRVQRLFGVPGVEPGDKERGRELQQPEDKGDIDVADDLGAGKSAGQLLMNT